MTTANTTSVGIGSMIAPGLLYGISYAEKLCKDIPADKFGHCPMKDVVLKNFLERYKLVAATLPSVSDETFLQANPMGGRMSEMFPTMGSAVMFMCGSHMQMHLGQISAWRRVMGMGSCN